MTVATEQTRSGAMPEPCPFDPSRLIALVATWDDAMRQRIRFANRHSATGEPLLADGVHGLETYETVLKKAILAEWRGHPLAPWAAETHGAGEHSVAVVVALLNGDPYIAYPKFWIANPDYDPDKPANKDNPKRLLATGEPFPRTVSQLWRYCGYDPTVRRMKGMDQEDALAAGNPRLKPRCRLIAESMLKAGNRDVYDAEKALALERGWTKGHAHSHALRIVAKVFLRELWVESRRLRVEGLW